MKTFLTILFICLLQNTFGQVTYYVSNAGNDAGAGNSPSTAWQTINKLKTFGFSPGDQILFRRGDTFTGEIIVGQSNVTYGAYGSGAKPIITGFTNVTSWTNLGSNIWESTAAVSSLPTLQVVSINGVSTPMGSYPNRDATYPFLPNYLNITSHSGTGTGTTTISNSSIIRDWSGADIVVRINHWTLDKETITGYSGNTLTYNGQSDGVTDGWGFFIQNDIRVLDHQNEWYYNPSTHKIDIYSTSSPAGVQVTSIDTLLYANDNNYVTVDNLDFKGANTSAAVFYYCQHATVTNCNISFTGDMAINGQNSSSYLDVENNNFSDIGSSAVWNSDGGSNWTIRNNNITRCGLVSVIKPNDYSNGAIQLYSPNALVQYNSIDSAAYSGILFRANNVQVRNNFVNHTSILRDDGGGIYTGFTGETGKIIDGNIVINAVGNSRGVQAGDAAGNGIYLDDLSDGVTVTNNTVANNISAGIFLHIGRNAYVRNNTVYNAGGTAFTKGALMVQSANGGGYAGYQRGNTVTNNIFFQKNSSQFDIFFYEDTDGTNTISNFGTVDSNYYASSNSTNVVRYHPYNGTYQDITFPTWQTTSGDEAHGIGYSGNGSIDTTTTQFIYNATQSATTTSLGANYKDVKGVSYSNITLQPYSSAILIYNSPSASAPTISVSGSQVINGSSTTVFATGTPASGQSITSYSWIKTSGTGTISSPASSSTGLTGLTGTSVYQCTVTQTDGQTASGNVTIVVNVPPTANAGTDQTIQLPTNSVSLSGSGTDVDGTITAYAWTKISGGSATITSPTSANTTITGLTAGTYIFQLQVTDNNGGTGTDQVTITVNPAPNVPPTANAGVDQTITLPTSSVTLTGSGTDTDGTITGYGWSKVSGGSAMFSAPTSATTSVTGLTQGTYVFRLTVTDNQGGTGTDDVQVTVNPAVTPPANPNAYIKLRKPTKLLNL